jgi:hypothetical protein
MLGGMLNHAGMTELGLPLPLAAVGAVPIVAVSGIADYRGC